MRRGAVLVKRGLFLIGVTAFGVVCKEPMVVILLVLLDDIS